MSTIGFRLKKERERLGMTQTCFAELAGTTRKSQFNYESDSRRPDADYLALLATIGVDVMYVLVGQRDPSIFIKQNTLTKRQATLLNNYDHLDEKDKSSLERTAFALAEQKKLIKGK